MKRAMIAAAAVLAAATAVACSNDDDGPGAGGGAAPDPVPGSGATNPPASGKTPGAVPELDLDGGTGPTAVLDAGDAGEDPDGAPATVPPEPQKRTIWAVDEREHLLRILAEDPSDVIDVAALDLPPGEHVVGLDFRPANGALYALTSASRIYTIDRTTAKVAAVGAGTTPWVSGQSYGFDFNPVADKIRVCSDVDQNLRIDPSTGAVVGVDGQLAFAPDDVNFRQSPNVVGAAYTNSTSPAPAETVLFGIDSTRNLLVKVAPPNDGLVTTIGPLGIDILAMAGFDIWGGPGQLEAYAALQIEGDASTGLYRIDLGTGQASLVGPIDHARPLRGIAVRP